MITALFGNAQGLLVGGHSPIRLTALAIERGDLALQLDHLIDVALGFGQFQRLLIQVKGFDLIAADHRQAANLGQQLGLQSRILQFLAKLERLLIGCQGLFGLTQVAIGFSQIGQRALLHLPVILGADQGQRFLVGGERRIELLQRAISATHTSQHFGLKHRITGGLGLGERRLVGLERFCILPGCAVVTAQVGANRTRQLILAVEFSQGERFLNGGVGFFIAA